METIINYVDNMFRNLPKTRQMEKLKEDILANMEDKYHELKQSGKTENEAIGIVISEFGNIDELMEEFDIEQTTNEQSLPSMTNDEVEQFLGATKKYGKMIGFGIILSILAPVCLLFTLQLGEAGTISSESTSLITGLIPLFLLVAISVVLFIYAGTALDKYKYMEYGVEMPTMIRSKIAQRNDEFHSSFVKSMIVGVVLLILSPITLIVAAIGDGSILYGVVILLAMVAIAVYILVYFGMQKDAYDKLLKTNEYSKREREKNRVVSAVSAVIWPLAVIIFLISGFVYEMWAINWIVFPVAGLLYSMFSEAYKILKTGD